MEEKINNLVEQRAPWLAKKNLLSILVFNLLKKLLRFDETIYAGDYIQNMSGADAFNWLGDSCLLYTSPSPRDSGKSRMPSSA